jgi:hypothetical protein
MNNKLQELNENNYISIREYSLPTHDYLITVDLAELLNVEADWSVDILYSEPEC